MKIYAALQKVVSPFSRGGIVTQEMSRPITVLGKGSYGCVVKPPLACNPDAPSDINDAALVDKPMVAKLYHRVKEQFGVVSAAVGSHAAAREYEKAKLIMVKDPTHKFSVGVRGWCTPSFAADEKSAYTHACAVPEALTISEQVLYENGGVSMFGVMTNKLLHVVTVLQSFTNLLEGLVVMNQPPGLVHMDIKEHNIAMDLNTATSRLIDYGYLRPYAKVVAPDKLHMLSRSQDVWPPEWDYLRMRLIAFAVKNEGLSEAEAVASLPEKVDPGTNFSLAANFLDHMGYSFPLPPDTVYHMINRQFDDKHPLARTFSREELYEQFIDDFANKLDIFSLGCTVAWVAKMGAAQLPEKLQAPIRLWIMGVTAPNPYDRFTPEMALAEYRIIWAEYENTWVAAAADPSYASYAAPGVEYEYSREASVYDGYDAATDLKFGGNIIKIRRRPSKSTKRTRRPSGTAKRRRRSKSRTKGSLWHRSKSRKSAKGVHANRPY